MDTLLHAEQVGDEKGCGAGAAAFAPQDTPVTMERANGFVVSLQAGDSFQYEHEPTMEEALALYDEPPRGWRAIGISAARNGRPFAELSAYTIAGMRADR